MLNGFKGLKRLKGLTAAVALGCACLAPLAMPTTAYAHTDGIVVNEFDDQDNFHIIYRWEHDEQDAEDLCIEGIHYVPVCLKVMDEYSITGGADLSNVEYGAILSMFTDKRDWGYYTCIIKFKEDGTYKFAHKFADQADWEGRQVHHDPEKWKKFLKNKYADDTNNLEYMNKEIDYYNPDEWYEVNNPFDYHTTAIDEALVTIAEYLKSNHPEIVAQNVALNQRDEAAALAQHVADRNAEREQTMVDNQAEVEDGVSDFIDEYAVDRNGNKIQLPYDYGYSWANFLGSEDAPHPNFDVNELINHVWYMSSFGDGYPKYGPDNYIRIKEDRSQFIVSFKPIIFVDDATGQIDWNDLRLEMVVHYRKDYDGTHTYYTDDNYLWELDRKNGYLFGGASLTPSEKPGSINEAKRIVHINSGDMDGKFATMGASLYYCEWQDGTTGHDFYLKHYYYGNMDGDYDFGHGQETHWYFHLTRVPNLNDGAAWEL